MQSVFLKKIMVGEQGARSPKIVLVYIINAISLDFFDNF